NRWRLDFRNYETKITSAIKEKQLKKKNGESLPVTDNQGLSTLVGCLEGGGSCEDVMEDYGSIHNRFHLRLGMMGCDNKTEAWNLNRGDPTGVLWTLESSMRDPAFYRLHKAIDNIVNTYKKHLEEYSLDK
ncbi:unnamed protein product, partial [Meganyctiphanes norvegica]